MRRNFSVFTVLVFTGMFLFIGGCEKDGAFVPQPETVSAEPSAKRATAKTSEQAPAPTEATDRVSRPRIQFEERIYDFGNVGPGTKNLCEFKFTNTGDDVLKIEKVPATCSCTIPTLDKKEYLPGESGTIKVEYRVRKKLGGTARVITVYSNDPVNPKVRLTVKAMVVPKVTARPSNFKLYPAKDNAGCPDIVLTSLDGKAFAIKSFKSTPSGIQADFDPSKKAARFVLKPKVKVHKLRANSSGRIEIVVDHPETQKLEIHFNVFCKFRISPATIIINDIPPGKSVTKNVWIISDDEQELEVESARSTRRTIRVLNEEKIGNRYKFTIEITPPAEKHPRGFFVDTFLVQMKNGDTLSVTCKEYYPKE